MHSKNESIFSKTKIFRSKCKIWFKFISLWNKERYKNATGFDISDFDKIDIDKLKNVPIGLGNLKSKVDELYTGKLETTR